MVDLKNRTVVAPSEHLVELVELLFFAYRDFTSDPDNILSTIGFGRVLHFVGRNPGMTVAELLDILKITKQSLGRVLRQLIEENYVVQQEGSLDRRQRLLYLTPRGKDLHRQLLAPQLRRIERALALCGEDDKGFRDMLLAMIDSPGRDQLRTILSRAAAPSAGPR
jgi:DNA-binding MarR family transcriptional regulator